MAQRRAATQGGRTDLRDAFRLHEPQTKRAHAVTFALLSTQAQLAMRSSMLLKMGVALAVHSCSLGAPILLEEMKEAGVKAEGGEKPATPACDQMRAMGQWNTAWDPFFDLSPEWTDQFLRSRQHLQKRRLHTKVC